jgi:endonuclease YncB( thermonuclease family)
MIPGVFIFIGCIAIDGDTLRCGDERVRLTRIDTPERHQAGFYQAKDALAFLIDGKQVICYVPKREKFGRLLGECKAGGVNLSDAMLSSGLAKRYRGRP